MIEGSSGNFFFFFYIKYEPAHDNTYNKTCVTSKDSDRPVHTPSMARVLVYPSLDSLEPVEGAFYQRRF